MMQSSTRSSTGAGERGSADMGWAAGGGGGGRLAGRGVEVDKQESLGGGTQSSRMRGGHNAPQYGGAGGAALQDA
jgi:hypothetical protein